MGGQLSALFWALFQGQSSLHVRCAGSACAGNPEWHHLLAAHTGNIAAGLCCHGVKRIIF